MNHMLREFFLSLNLVRASMSFRVSLKSVLQGSLPETTPAIKNLASFLIMF